MDATFEEQLKAHREAKLAAKPRETQVESAAYKKAYDLKHKAKHAEYFKLYYEDNRARKIAAATAWQKAHPDKAKAIWQRYQAAHMDDRRLKSLSYSRANKALCRARIAVWQRANPGKVAAYSANRRSATGRLSPGLATALLLEQSGRCFYCSVDLASTDYHLDHWMPLAKGGLNIDENIVLACPRCNTRKGAKQPMEFVEQLQRETGTSL